LPSKTSFVVSSLKLRIIRRLFDAYLFTVQIDKKQVKGFVS